MDLGYMVMAKLCIVFVYSGAALTRQVAQSGQDYSVFTG